MRGPHPLSRPTSRSHRRRLSALTPLADDDTVPGFAPSLATMLSSFSNDAAAAKAAFCGLAADVSSPATGTTTRLYIADAFDVKWVRTPASVDVIYGSVRPCSPPVAASHSLADAR